MVKNSLCWLLENAGPIIRYRTATELLGELNQDKVGSLRKDLLSCKLVQSWLGNLQPNFWALHGSKSVNFENAMGKLYEFGLRKGIEALDEKTKPFENWLRQQVDHPTCNYFYLALVASFLSMTGYSTEEAVNECILERLETVYPFAKKANFNEIYIPQDSYHGFPKAFRDKPLLNPALETDKGSMLPSIHDINAFLHSASLMDSAQLKTRVEKIMEFVLRPEYQKLYPGYGVVMISGKFYSAGWSVHLPGYFESDAGQTSPYKFTPHPDNPNHPSLLLRLSMMSHSKAARAHSWFNRMLSMLESFRIEDGILTFPRSLLLEKEGYWVNGYRLGLEVDRRIKKAIICESTFRYHEIIKRNI
jgi:hypothetical protein